MAQMWDIASEAWRLAVLAAHGWETRDGRPDRTARRAATMPWANLSPAMQRILTSA